MKIKSRISPGLVLPSVLAIGSITGIMAIAVISTITNNSTNNASALTYSTDTDVSFTFNPTLSISLSDTNINIDNLLPGLSSESSPITVSVNSNTPYGYSLFASVGNSTDYNTTSLTHEDSDIGNNAAFISIATNASLPQLTTDNTWGYTYRTHNTNNADNEGWSNYNGLPLYSTADNNTSTNNPALLIDTKSPADSTESIDFKIAARASTAQASGTYNNVINFYAVGKPAPPILYEEVAKMSKGAQTLADMRAEITYPTNRDYHEDTSNSGVYEYDSAVFGVSSDANNNYKIYYYRGVLEPEGDQGTYGSDGKATTYPNYVRFSNNTCWRIVRTTGSGGVKMVYNGTWTGSTCAKNQNNAQLTTSSFNSSSASIVYAGYTYNSSYTNNSATNGISVDTVLGNNSNLALNNTRSTIKTYIEDTWYANNMTAYTNKLESVAGYCNDRTLYNNDYSQQLSNVDTSQNNSFGASYRVGYNSPVKAPSLTCPRGDVDNYRYVANSNGTANELKYPAALLTADEVTLAGSGYNTVLPYNAKSFLRSGNRFWLLSPNIRGSDGYASEFTLHWIGLLGSHGVNNAEGVRPAISLKPGMAIVSGTGTATDPWVVSAQ